MSNPLLSSSSSEATAPEALRDALADVEVAPLLGGLSNDALLELLYEQR